MKIAHMIRLLEATDGSKPHIIGDGHAVSIASSVSNSEDLAKNGSAIGAVNAQAQAVPDGAGVIVSVGGQHVLEPQGAVEGLAAMIDNLITRGCTVVYVGFPPIDLNNKNPSTTPNIPDNNNGKQVVQFAANRIQEMTPNELAAFEAEQTAAGARAQRYTIPEFLPMSIFYRNKGYTSEYNTLLQQMLAVTTNKERATSVGFAANEINPGDPNGISASPNAYARVAGEAVKALEQLQRYTENPQDDQPIAAADQLDPQEFEELDLDGDGKVTVGEYNQYMADNNIDPMGNDIPVSVANGLEGIFGILMSYIERDSGENISAAQLRDTLAAGRLPEGMANTSNIQSGAELSTTSGSQAENALVLAARRKWANVPDREVWIAALIAQCRVETANFTLSTEIWGPTSTQLSYDIEGPNPAKARQLGNDQPGDGFKYRGRGWIQLTGKANYQAAVGAAGADIVNQPDLAATAAVANRTAIHYFETRVMNRTQANNIVQISRLVNGGNNGLAQRVANFEQLLDNLRQQTPITQAGEAGENGRLDTSMLTSIGGNHKLIDPAAQAYKRMVQAAAQDGIEWTITDSYRTYAAQVDVARRKGLYSQGGLAARPGTSNHGWGKAVDLGGGANSYNTPENNWLQDNAGRFGFTTIRREPWHWEWNSHNG